MDEAQSVHNRIIPRRARCDTTRNELNRQYCTFQSDVQPHARPSHLEGLAIHLFMEAGNLSGPRLVQQIVKLPFKPCYLIVTVCECHE